MTTFGVRDTDRLLASTCRSFARDVLLPGYRERDRTGQFPRQLWHRMADLGLLGLRVPAELGGTDASCESTGYAAEEIARGDFTCAYAVMLTGLVADIVARHASPELQRAVLPGVASGDIVVGLSLTEPGAGSDAAAIECRARRDGDAYILTGQKASVSLVSAADAVVVFARTGGTPGHRGITAFWLPTNAPGVATSPYSDMGQRALGRGDLFLDDVRIPAGHLIGAEGAGFYQVMRGFDYARVVISMMCIAAAQQTLDETIVHTRQRSAFGAPLSRYQGVAFVIAENAAKLASVRALCVQALRMRDAGVEHTLEASMCKMLGPRYAVDAIHELLLLHGHYGYTQELPHEQRLRDVIGLELGDGPAQIQKLVVSRHLLGREYAP
jgi:cyclohexanecarboxyl-CoA dehydrogenase